MAANQTIEEARIIVANRDLCAAATEYFTDAGVLAFGDFRDEDQEIMVRDAFADNVDYVIFASVWHLLELPTFKLKRRSNNELLVKVYLRRDGDVKTMTIGAAIQMILERRHM